MMLRYLPLLTPLLSAETFLVSDQILNRQVRETSGDVIPKCTENPEQCSNGGLCVDTEENTAFICECGVNFFGTTCESTHVDCTETMCGFIGGSCTEAERTELNVAAFVCACDAGYTSSSDMSPCVDIDECVTESVTCMNPAICNNLVAEFQCGSGDPISCDFGWTGTFCEESVNPCTTDLDTLEALGTDLGACVEDQAESCTPGEGAGSAGSYTCACLEAFKGQTCSERKMLISDVTATVEMGGVSADQFADMDLEAVEADTEAAVEAFYEGNDDFLGVSDVTISHDEAASQVDITYVTSLAQAAEVVLRKRRSTRSRRAALSGDTQANAAAAAEAAGAGAKAADANLAAATVTASTNAAEVQATPETDACVNNACENGGTCEDIVGNDDTPAGRTCTCVTGFEGDSCETNTDDCATNPCANGFECVDAVNAYTCDCSASTIWTGQDCDFDAFCDASPCSNGGTCDEGTCSCTGSADGIFSGITCDVQESCKVMENEVITDRVCVDNSRCIDEGATHTCQCTLGYFPANDCSQNVCTDFCSNSGTCTIDAEGAPSCACVADSGYTGDQCEDSVCDDEACDATNMSGVCSIVDGAAVCECNGVFAGADCMVDACANADAACVEGTCTASADGFYCACDAGYIGTDCSVQECSGNGAINNGACVCESPFLGESCDVECAGAWIDSETCTCSTGMVGDACDEPKKVCENNSLWLAPNVCFCVGDFVGDCCEEAKVECGTNGDWMAPNDCECDTGFTGDICENASTKMMAGTILVAIFAMIL